jgi:hypothetical protein
LLLISSSSCSQPSAGSSANRLWPDAVASRPKQGLKSAPFTVSAAAVKLHTCRPSHRSKTCKQCSKDISTAVSKAVPGSALAAALWLARLWARLYAFHTTDVSAALLLVNLHGKLANWQIPCRT